MSLHRLVALLLAVASAVHASPTPVAAAATAAAAAAPADVTAAAANTAFNTDAWVTVGSDGVAKTVTPALTIVSGVPSIVDASPTTSGTATTTAQPEATATNGGGSFPVCSNVDGELAPFCAPADHTTLNPGQTYYITWDPEYFSAHPNTSVIITGNLYNETTGEITTQAFMSNAVAAGWSFYAWSVDKALLNGASSRGVNISLSMTYLSAGNSSSSSSTHIRGPTVRVARPEPYRQQPSELPTGAALYIGLPSIFLFVVIMVMGTCVWNKHHRQINIGSAMGRGRYGKLAGGGSSSRKGYGVGRSRRQRTGAVNLDSKDAILLQNREAARGAGSSRHDNDNDDDNNDDDGYDDFGMTRPAQHYSDSPSEAEAKHQKAYQKNANKTRAAPLALSDGLVAPGRPRSDSDALGSLAGTPTEADFSGEPASTGNAFRDELRRQNNKQI